ncbi:MAG TPA: 50S ribosomal protein L4 [Bacteroidetes bacterium]|nr:50S ribosomal protein L4 [Bacteroidota bacterium]
MKVAVYNKSGEDTGKKVELRKEIFEIEPNDHAIYLDAKQFMANKRQGTHKSKERSEVAGSTRKIKRQKGTGTARFGDIKNPIFRGGGRVFGPRPRFYGFKLNRKVKRLARKSALTYKAREKGIMVVEDWSLDAPKTREFADVNKNLKIDGKKSLFVLSEKNKNLYLSSRNLPGTKVVTVEELNTYDILDAGTLVFMESSIDLLNRQFGIQ